MNASAGSGRAKRKGPYSELTTVYNGHSVSAIRLVGFLLYLFSIRLVDEKYEKTDKRWEACDGTGGGSPHRSGGSRNDHDRWRHG